MRLRTRLLAAVSLAPLNSHTHIHKHHQALFRKGDEASIRQLQNLAGQELFPGAEEYVYPSVTGAMRPFITSAGG